MNILKFLIKCSLLFTLLTVTMITQASTIRVSCEGGLEKTNVTETNAVDKKTLKDHLTITFKNDRAILPGAILTCYTQKKHMDKFCESRTVTQLRILRLDNLSLVYKYVNSEEKQTTTFRGICKLESQLRAQ